MSSNSVLFGVALSLWAFILARRLHQRLPNPLLNPLLLAPLLVIVILVSLGIPYRQYNEGGSIVSFFLGPATVALAVPLYRQLPTIRRMWLPILVGATAGSAMGILSSIILVKWLGGTDQVLRSMISRSTTTPIAVGITASLGGLSPLTVVSVVVTGTFGGIIGPELLRLIGVKHPVAVGIAIGTASHAGGTSRAIRIGQVEGSMSGMAIVLTGLITALLVPIVVPLLLR